MTLRPPRFISPVEAAMHRMRLTWRDLAQMQLDLRSAIARNNNDLVHSFRRTT